MDWAFNDNMLEEHIRMLGDKDRKKKFDDFIKEQQEKEVKHIEKLQDKIDKYTKRTMDTQNKIREEVKEYEKNVDHLVNQQSVMNENSILRSSLK